MAIGTIVVASVCQSFAPAQPRRCSAIPSTVRSRLLYGQYYRGQRTISTATVEEIVTYTLHSAPYSALYSEGSAAKASRNGGPAVLGTSYGTAGGLAR
jgi:hypothetical protein